MIIQPGDDVVALVDGGQDDEGLPVNIPIAGRRYKVNGVYRARYGIGCTLLNLDPSPYRGYLLYVERPFASGMRAGWYFRKLVKDDIGADGWWTEEFKRQSTEFAEQNKPLRRRKRQR